MKRLFLTLLMSFTLIGAGLVSALAGDNAFRSLIGYSPDKRYFAFEQFGVQDGSGFAYSEIFLIDLHEDSWVDGGPFRYQTDDEMTFLGQARQASRTLAQEALDGRDISVPAITLTGQALGAFDVDPHKLDFGAPGFSFTPPMASDRQTLSLTLLDVPSGEDCNYIDDVSGYQLDWTNENGAVTILHKDARIPASRFCPLDYRISEIILPFGSYTLDDAVVLISVFRQGFEGPDRRYIALPLNQ